MTEIATILDSLNLSYRRAAELLEPLSKSDIARLALGERVPTGLELHAFKGLAAEAERRGLKGSPGRLRRPSAALAATLEGDGWTEVTARLALPVLVDLAKARRPTTYGDLHEAVAKRGGKAEIGTLTKYGMPLGRIGETMEEAAELLGLEKVPPIEALVCNARTGMPSQGIDHFLKQYLRPERADLARKVSSESDRPAIIQQIHQEIFEFLRWDEVLAVVGLTGDPDEDA